ncbi:MAG: cell division protein ZapA [Treponema sp.]|nr:cell division protein ZapA [Treponema sp.]
MAVIQINILGTSFVLKAEEDLPYLEKIRDYYKNVCDEIQKNDGIRDQKQTAVLAGILIADELYKEKQKAMKAKDARDKNGADSLEELEADRLTKSMIEKIDRALS